MTADQKILYSLLKGEAGSKPSEIASENFPLLVRRHKLLPAVGKEPGIKCYGPELYKKESMEWGARALLMKSVLTEAIKRLATEGISPIAVKGPVLSHQLYNSWHGRFYTDLDLLVKPEELQKSIDVITGSGFTMVNEQNFADPKARDKHFRSENDLVFRHIETGVVLELHLGIYVSFLLDREREVVLLDKTEMVEIEGSSYRVLSKEHNLIYLCLHAAKHMFFRLCWVRDIAAFLDQKELSEEYTISLVKKLGLERPFSLALRLSSLYFDTQLTKKFDEFTRKYPNRFLFRLAKGIIAGPGELVYEKPSMIFKRRGRIAGVDQARPRHLIYQVFFLVFLRKGLGNRVRFLYSKVS